MAISDITIIIAQGKDVSGNWMELIIPVLVVIGYAIVGIFRLRSNMSKSKLADDTSGPRYKPIGGDWDHDSPAETDLDILPEHKARQVDRNIEQKLTPAAPGASTRHISRAPSTPEQRRTLDAFLQSKAPPAAVTARSPQPKLVHAHPSAPQPQPPKPAPPVAHLYKACQELSPSVRATLSLGNKKSQPKPVHTETTVAPISLRTAEESTLSIFDRITDPDELRRAIIYAEILGKPVAFRDF